MMMRNESEMQIFRELTIGVENMLDSMFGENKTLHRVNFPKKNIVQTSEDSYRIDFPLAGYSKEQIEVYVDKDNTLNVKSEKVDREEVESEDGEFPKFLMKEIAQRAFHTKMKLIDTEVSGAKMVNGVLSVFVKKRQQSDNQKINVD
jgi:HSP20 family molecular chaperone IbpA